MAECLTHSIDTALKDKPVIHMSHLVFQSHLIDSNRPIRAQTERGRDNVSDYR